MHNHTIHKHRITGFIKLNASSLLLFISVRKMNLEQSVKDLQAQNAEFQTLILTLANGQNELKALLTKKDKKTKKPKGVINMGRRFRGRPKKAEDAEIPKNEEDEERDDISIKNNQGSHVGSDGEEEEEEEYPEDEDESDERYRQLEERLRSVEIQKVPGLDFEELGLVPGVVIPPKFKTPSFAKYDGVSCPKLHLRSYVRKIQPHTADKKLWIHFFQESLAGTQLEWYYQLESTNIHTWEDLVVAFYKQYQYNSDLAPTRMQLQSMSMGPKESFKEYAQKWRDLAGRVKPSLNDRELVDMFMNTLTGPFYSHLLGSSSSGFTDLILTGERVESGIRSGKIQVATSSGTIKKPYNGRNESKTVGAILVSSQAPTQQQQKNQRKQQGGQRTWKSKPKRSFTPLHMPLSRALQHLLNQSLITLLPPYSAPANPAPGYKHDARCDYHSNSPGHDTEDCGPLKHKIQDLIDEGVVEFGQPKKPHKL